MDVTLLYFDGCPNWTLARDRLHDAMRRAGLDKRWLRYRTVGVFTDVTVLAERREARTRARRRSTTTSPLPVQTTG